MYIVTLYYVNSIHKLYIPDGDDVFVSYMMDKLLSIAGVFAYSIMTDDGTFKCLTKHVIDKYRDKYGTSNVPAITFLAGLDVDAVIVTDDKLWRFATGDH